MKLITVASKSEADAIYADLVGKVVSKFAKEHPNKPPPNNRALPDLPEFNSDLDGDSLPSIAERQLPVNRKIKVAKEQRLAQHRCDAAARVLTRDECVALEIAELAWVFESLRAGVHVPFDFHNLIRVLWGFSDLQRAACKLCDFPDVQRLHDLQSAFHEVGMVPSDKSKCMHVLLLLVELKERTQWPLGIIYVSSREGSECHLPNLSF